MSRAVTLCVVICAATVAARAAQTPGSTVSSQQAATYRMDVATISGPAGPSGLRIAIKNTSNGSLVRNFDVVHEKPFHLFVVGRDLRFFRHLYPEPLPDGSLESREDIPPGEYLVVADFLPSGGSPQLLQRVVDLRADLRGDSRAPRKVEVSPPNSAGS